jgi:hypothetical protein
MRAAYGRSGGSAKCASDASAKFAALVSGRSDPLDSIRFAQLAPVWSAAREREHRSGPSRREALRRLDQRKVVPDKSIAPAELPSSLRTQIVV